jgi:tetratricopeptide (TPR) repeat protein
VPYVRTRGNQLAIVHGAREAGTGKVQQQVLFTLYSKAEALAALGRGDSALSFRGLLGRQYPGLKFNWKALTRGIEENLGALPETYEYREDRLRGRFHQDLCAFAKQLFLTDPQHLLSSAQLIDEHRHELEYVQELIGWRLKLRHQKKSDWNQDNPFYWRFALHGRGVPAAPEEHGAELFYKGEYTKAAAIFRLLIDCYGDYAEGHNYLGLIALEQRKYDEAVAQFQTAMAQGRKLFPTRISKKQYWSDHSTRPYIRGLRSLTDALVQAGRFEEALPLCDRLEAECGDRVSAAWHRATIGLNTGRWDPAVKAGRYLCEETLSEASLMAAFGLFEQGRQEEALVAFLIGALNCPRAARMVLGEKTSTPLSNEGARDHNAGVSLCRELHAFLRDQSRESKKFFRALVRDPRVVKLLDEAIAVVHRWSEADPVGHKAAFKRMTLMRSPEFARMQAQGLKDLVEPAGAQLAVH